MKVKDIMTQPAIHITPGESVAVAARTLTHYNIGALPVCTPDGKLCGMLTDRDVVIRCIAPGKEASKTMVRDIMTGKVESARPDMDVGVAAHLMGRQQIRRLPVTENGRLCGMVTLGDLAKQESSIMDAADALSDIAQNIHDQSTW